VPSGFAGGGDLDGIVFDFGDELLGGFAGGDLRARDVAGVYIELRVES
jgi:hypothetical protein